MSNASHVVRILFILILLWSIGTSMHAADCWRVTGWTSLSSGLERATLATVTCTTVPDGSGWVQPLSASSEWLRLDLSDSHVTGWTFEPLLFLRGYDSSGTPIVETDYILCVGCPNEMELLPYPPEQGVPGAGSKVKLRHQNTGKCMYTSGVNGQKVRNGSCRVTGSVFVLDSAGGGTYRLRNAATGQCAYATATNGRPLYHWVCWSDPGMRFQLIAAGGGYRLRHVDQSQCPYGNSANGGIVHTWGCWSDPNMIYKVDIVSY